LTIKALASLKSFGVAPDQYPVEQVALSQLPPSVIRWTFFHVHKRALSTQNFKSLENERDKRGSDLNSERLREQGI
jgi:hypothetical protein